MDSPSTSNNQDESSSQETSANLPNGVKLEGEECKDIEKKSSKDGRCSKQTKEKNIKIQIQDKNVYSCPTDGKETILNLIKEKIKKEKIKKSTEKMLVKSSKGHIINLGLPTGVLEEDVKYKCIYKSRVNYNIDEMMRDCDVERYDNSWDIKYFYVKFNKGQPQVSRLSRFKIVEVLQVPFFEGESFFDALSADGRFDQEKNGKKAICTCQFLNEKQEIFSLTDKALQDMVFMFSHSKADPIEASDKKPLRRPSHLPVTPGPSHAAAIKHNGSALSHVSIKQEPVEDQLEETQAPAIEQSVSSDISGTLNKACRWTKDEKLKSIEQAFGLEFQPKKTPNAENKRKEKIKNFCYEQLFSLNSKHHIFVADMADLVNGESKCVGAIVAVKLNRENEIVKKSAVGTCFRIGKQFVITNAHVLDGIKKNRYKLECIDFNYTGNVDQQYIYHVDDSVVLKDKRLDYAILKLREPEESLPPSITASNFQIARPDYNIDEAITLIGHPNNNAKLIDSSCPIRPPSQDPKTKLYIRQQKNYTSNYDVSTMDKGSSGSPGFHLNSKKVVVLHHKGFHYETPFSFEEGILMSSIVVDVKAKIENVGGDLTLADIFGEETAKDFEGGDTNGM